MVNAAWPTPVAGFCSGPFEKIMNSIFELWAEILPERAMACTFNLDYLLIGGRDGRQPGHKYFMWYDWMVGGWGARNGRDGWAATGPVFGVQLGTQPFEGQERLAPVLTTCHELRVDSGGPGEFRGGMGVQKGVILTKVDRTVASYCCDRERSITWGLWGGLPSIPHGVWVNPGTQGERYLGSIFSNVALEAGDHVTRPSAGGGGLGDPLERDEDRVCEDVADGYVSIERAAKDYGVIVKEIDADLADYKVDHEATLAKRAYIRANRAKWLEQDAGEIAARVPRRRTRYDGSHPDLWCDRRLGIGRAAGDDDHTVQGHAAAPDSPLLGQEHRRWQGCVDLPESGLRPFSRGSEHACRSPRPRTRET